MTETEARAHFLALRDQVLDFLRERERSCPVQAAAIATVRGAFEGARLPARRPAPRRLPGCRHLDAALAMAKTGPMAGLATAFERFEPCMRWIRTEHYREALGDDYMDNYAYANLLGFDAVLPHERLVAAFFLIGPGRHYPRHHHEAEEIYFPFGGDVLWGQGDRAAAPRPAGEPVHNTPWLPHEMITKTLPLFTFCVWLSPGPIRLAELTG